MNETYKGIDPQEGQLFKRNERFLTLSIRRHKPLNLNGIRLSNQLVNIPHFQVRKGK
jgi:hypothetical protein